MINRVFLIGNTGKDPEIRTTATNKKVAKFSFATTERRKNAESITSWHSIVAWDNLAEIVEKYVKKGMMLYIEGKINYGKYDKDGTTHYYTEIIANNIQMLSKKDQAANSEPTDEAPTTQQKYDGNYIPDSQDDDRPF